MGDSHSPLHMRNLRLKNTVLDLQEKVSKLERGPAQNQADIPESAPPGCSELSHTEARGHFQSGFLHDLWRNLATQESNHSADRGETSILAFILNNSNLQPFSSHSQ